MSERSSTLLSVLVVTAFAALGLLVGGTAWLAGHAAAANLVSAVSMCAWSLAQTRTVPLALVFPSFIGLASMIALARAIVSYRRERRLLRALPLEPFTAGSDLAEIARTTGVDLYRTPAQRPAAFCFGLIRPRVVFTSGLLERLSAQELAAAFWHEAQHARLREPFRCLLARLASSTFFWLPVLRDLFERYSLVRELDADRLATARTSRQALAGALHEVISEPPLAGAVGFADLAAARVDRLLDPKAVLPSLFRRSRVALSLVVVALLSVAFTYPTNIPVSRHVQTKTMMMKVAVMTPVGMKWLLVPCPS